MSNKHRGFPPGVRGNIKINIDPNTLPPIVCPNCGWGIFIQAHIIKRIGALQSPNGRPQPLAVPVFLCTRCETILRNDNLITVDEFEKMKEAQTQ